MTRPFGHVRDLLRNRHGGSALEFALVAMPFFLGIFGTLEFGRLFFYDASLSSATAAAARLFLFDKYATHAEVEQRIAYRMLNVDPDRLEVVWSDVTSDGVTYRTVLARYDFDFILPTLFGFDVELSDEVTVPIS